jgi:hypothetical protein
MSTALSGPFDVAQMSCKQIEAELSVMGQAYMTSTAKERRARKTVSAEAFLFPASLGAPPPATSAKLKARVDELRRASRVKRCASIWADRAATA